MPAPCRCAVAPARPRGDGEPLAARRGAPSRLRGRGRARGAAAGASPAGRRCRSTRPSVGQPGQVDRHALEPWHLDPIEPAELVDPAVTAPDGLPVRDDPLARRVDQPRAADGFGSSPASKSDAPSMRSCLIWRTGAQVLNDLPCPTGRRRGVPRRRRPRHLASLQRPAGAAEDRSCALPRRRPVASGSLVGVAVALESRRRERDRALCAVSPKRACPEPGRLGSAAVPRARRAVIACSARLPCRLFFLYPPRGSPAARTDGSAPGASRGRPRGASRDAGRSPL